ncbi:hypothetical protein N7495_001538 [Penicillium taxi]|uniref:uncharacterized protein n=1 Tax=Penicillium taxi TaxID=168475 RepID=UPI0025451A04|nr:uncharacterized protein N7495_001538 [Penicillium taxi]KAJ5908856.1 hypothetical protein N7495_001538 [Penicillium taxi]
MRRDIVYAAGESPIRLWPVIAGIIVGAVILLAILACVFNCLCCGYQCCKCCCSCCCPSGQRRNKSPKYQDEPQANNNPYQFQAPLQNKTPYPQPQTPQNRQSSFSTQDRHTQYPNQSVTNIQPTPPLAPQYRQTAQFDISQPAAAALGDDALPEMPTWAGATKKRIEHDPGEVEMALMKPINSNQGVGTSVHPDGYRGFGPTAPYARRPSGSTLGSQVPVATEDPYARRPSASGLPTQDPYGRRPSGLVPSGAVDQYGRRSPGPQAAYNTSSDQYGRRSPAPQAAYNTSSDQYGRRSPAPQAAYNTSSDQYGRRSPAPQAAYNTFPDQYGHHSTGPTPYGQALDPYSDPYGRHSPNPAGYSPAASPGPGLVRGLGQNQTMSPYGPPHDHQGSNSGYSPSGGNEYYPITTASPIEYRNVQTSPAPSYKAFSPISEPGQAAGFSRQSSLSSNQYPPSYHTQPPLPALGSTHHMPYQAYSNDPLIAEPSRNRPPSLLQSGRKPVPNTFRAV